MAKKSMKNLAKIAAGLGAAYALSKMGKGTMDGTEGDFPASSTPEVKGRMQPTSRGAMDGTEGEMTAIAKPKRGSVEAFRQAESERQARIAAMRSGANMGTDRSAFNAKVKAINEARTGMKNPRYKKGGSVHVKTKIGYSKATKIY
jgi:hypothetical protein